jgi:predicted metal-dependent HD superfamily phosphohydrolase
MNEYRQARNTCLEMCLATNDQLLTNKVLSRWKDYFEQHLHESSEEESHANQVPSRENNVIINFPSRDEIAIEYLKDNKAAGLDLIAAKLLKSGLPSLMNALNEMIQRDTT